MADWPGLLLLAALIVLSGALLVLNFLPRRARWSLPTAFAALALGVIATGWLGLILAEFGWFGRWQLAAALGVLSIALFIRLRLSGKLAGPDDALPDEPRWASWEWVMLAVWLVAAVWLFFRPHEYVYGGTDAGVYVSLGAEISRHGGFRLVDETFAALPPELQAAVVRPLPNTPGTTSYLFPGFYVTDAAAGRLTPQFYPLHPVLQAAVFGAAGGGASGVRAELLLVGLWMLLGTLAVYLTAREAGGPVVGALALAGLSLMGLQVWFGRYPTSESLTQFMLWTGLWGVARWLGGRGPSALWAFVAGCAFGAVFLVRIDSLVMLPVFSIFLVWRWIGGWQRADSWFALPFVALVVHSLLHGHFLSAPYFYETVGYGVFLLQRAWPVLLVAILVATAVLWWLARNRDRLHAPEKLRRPFLAALVFSLLAYAVYGWFIRPGLATTTMRPDVFSGGEIPVTNHENWLRLGWYLSPVGVWLGVLGGCLLVWRIERRTALLVAFGWLFSIVYLWNISANPHHVYVMRRYVPVVVPFFILGGACLLACRGFSRESWSTRPGDILPRLPYPAAPAILAVFAAVWLAGLGWHARGLISQVDNPGLVEQIDNLAGQMPPEAVLLFNDPAPVGQGDIWGTPLKFIFGHDAFTLRQPPEAIAPSLVETIKTWQNSGRTVIWVGDTGWLDEASIPYHTELVTMNREHLENSYFYRPQAIILDTTVLTVSYLESD
ncbi:MAG: hypothetical protein KBF17_03140 [Candidatus Promineofilum sp.]|nr:hypothetical protein [Promineifilum sp.]MBP9657046.1 hypothetical protein [Promineifilum sp.]